MEKIDDFTYFDERAGKEGRRSTIYNEKYEEDMNYAIELNRRIASLIGIWPIFSLKGPVPRLKFKMLVKRLQSTLIYLLLVFLLVPGILHIVLEEKTFKRKMLKIGPMILNTMALLKYSALLLQEHKIRDCIKFIERDWQILGNERFRNIMRRNATVGRRLTQVCAFTFYLGGICYRLIKTLLTPKRIVNGLIHKPFPSPLFSQMFRFNTSASPVYEGIFTVQVVASVVTHSTTITTCSYAAVLATHACGQFDIVAYLLTKLVDEDNDNGRLTEERARAVDRRLRIIVELHLKVLRYLEQVEDLLCETCLVEMLGGTVILCLTGYYFILDLEKNDALGILTYSVMIASLVALLFTYNFIGELVTDKAKKVETSSYMINWYDLPPKKGLCIGLIISISRYPRKLTAGKMLELSMYNFGSIMKSATGYLNLLRTMME